MGRQDSSGCHFQTGETAISKYTLIVDTNSTPFSMFLNRLDFFSSTTQTLFNISQSLHSQCEGSSKCSCIIKQKQYCKNNDQMQSLNIAGPCVREYQATQIDSFDCCSATVRVSTALPLTPEKPKSRTRERGIKLAHHSQSSDRLKLLKLTLPTRTPSLSGLPSPQQSGLLQEKKLLTARKCIDYKNRKVQQHTQQEEGRMILSLEEGGLKLTGRTLAQSGEIEESVLRESEGCNIIRDMKSKRSRKTFEKLYQQYQGRQIITLQSQASSSDLHSEYSQVEAFHFP